MPCGVCEICVMCSKKGWEGQDWRRGRGEGMKE